MGVTANCFAEGAQADAPQRFVQVSATRLRAQPMLWATGRAELAYGQALTILGTEGGWVRAKTTEGVEGFVPLSAVSERKILLQGSANDVRIRADESDLVLAGKGFSENLEEALRSSDPAMNYDAVTALEKQQVADSEVAAFVVAGDLSTMTGEVTRR